jgi:hypothetical protein
MDIVRLIFRYIHLIGFAFVTVSIFLEYRRKTEKSPLGALHGGLLQLITGLILMFIALADINHLKVTVKFFILIVLLVILFLKRKSGFKGIWLHLSVFLVMSESAVAVFWM